MARRSLAGPFDVRQTAALTGLSVYMVDYLCRSGTLEPSGGARPGRGRRRKYSFADVVFLRGLAKLLEQDLSVSRLRDALRELRREHPELTPTRLPARYLVTDGKNVYFTDGGTIQNLTARGQLAFAFVLELKQLRTEVITKVRSFGWDVSKAKSVKGGT